MLAIGTRFKKPSLASPFFLFLCILGTGACGSGVTQVRETPTGGFLTYPIRSQADILTAKGRAEAISIMQEKCASGFRITTEGEVPKVGAKQDRTWRGQMSGDRLWGVQYECK